MNMHVPKSRVITCDFGTGSCGIFVREILSFHWLLQELLSADRNRSTFGNSRTCVFKRVFTIFYEKCEIILFFSIRNL